MRLTVASLRSKNFTVDISEDDPLHKLEYLCSCSMKESVLVHKGYPLVGENKSLKELGVRNGDVICRVTLPRKTAAIPKPHRYPPFWFGLPPLKKPARLPPKRLSFIQRLRQAIADVSRIGLGHFALPGTLLPKLDPDLLPMSFDNPESPEKTVMLYVNCKVNGYAVKAFVDSGAQDTAVSSKFAKRCQMSVDKIYAGIATGVGTQRITGRVHLAQILLKHHFFTSPLSVLEDQPIDVILGLDFLKRHKCIIDLEREVLWIGTTRTEIPFLPE